VERGRKFVQIYSALSPGRRIILHDSLAVGLEYRATTTFPTPCFHVHVCEMINSPPPDPKWTTKQAAQLVMLDR
jgi:hypothetical protein